MKPEFLLHRFSNRILIVFLLLNFSLTATAQYVNIPDGHFSGWLKKHGLNNCFIGTQLDTTCSALLSITSLDVSGQKIKSLTGITYFDNLTYLDCSNNLLTDLPDLPPSLNVLRCDDNGIGSLPSLPSSLTVLECARNQISSLPALPSGLDSLDCSANHIHIMPSLPSTIKSLNCAANQFSSLPALPAQLVDLNCSTNPITTLPALPSTLKTLTCVFLYQLANLPALPPSLETLNCASGILTSLPMLPETIRELSCYNQQLESLPDLPDSLHSLTCYGNQLTSLPSLPSHLENLHCSSNQLATLPTLPSLLRSLLCGSNQLASLPSLPDSLLILTCDYNQLSALPVLPEGLLHLVCSKNPLFTLPDLPSTLITLRCAQDTLTSIPALPGTLQTLECWQNQLTSLPPLPASLISLSAQSNLLTELPVVPSSINYVNVSNNKLISVDNLPDSLFGALYIVNNPSLTCLPPVSYIEEFHWRNTGIACRPNYIGTVGAIPSINALPICSAYTPPAPLSIGVSGNPKVCPGDSKIYTTQQAKGVTYNWTIPAGAVIDSGAGTFRIYVTYTNAFIQDGEISVSKTGICGGGTSAVVSRMVQRNMPSVPSGITGPANGVCGLAGAEYSVINNPSVTYNWQADGNQIVSGQGTNSIIVNWDDTIIPGAGWHVYVRAVNACGQSLENFKVIRPYPAYPGPISGPASVCANQQNVVYEIDTLEGADYYNWIVPASATIASGQGTPSITVNFGSSGGEVRVKGFNNCLGGSYRKLPVTINCRNSLMNETRDDVVIYPNPSKGVFNIYLNDDYDNITVLDAFGQVVYMQATPGRTIEVSLPDLAQGFYIARLKGTNKLVEQPFIIQ